MRQRNHCSSLKGIPKMKLQGSGPSAPKSLQSQNRPRPENRLSISRLDVVHGQLERRDRVDDLLCGHDRAGIVREIDVESGVHLLSRVIRRCVFYHRDVIAELSGKANGRFDAGVGYESDHDKLMDAVLLELQI